MSNPFLGEVRTFGFGFAPVGWALCSGQLLPISQNSALFALLGTMYGGNGTTNFALPDLQGRVPVHRATNGSFVQGAKGGTETVTLNSSMMPAHNHTLLGTTTTANSRKAASAALAASDVATDYYYSPPTNTVQLNQASISSAAGNQPHPNLQPFLVINYSIAMSGIFPSRG